MVNKILYYTIDVTCCKIPFSKLKKGNYRAVNDQINCTARQGHMGKLEYEWFRYHESFMDRWLVERASGNLPVTESLHG